MCCGYNTVNFSLLLLALLPSFPPPYRHRSESYMSSELYFTPGKCPETVLPACVLVGRVPAPLRIDEALDAEEEE